MVVETGDTCTAFRLLTIDLLKLFMVDLQKSIMINHNFIQGILPTDLWIKYAI